MFVMLFGLMILATGSVSAQNCTPNDDQIAIFEHTSNHNNGGKCKVLSVGEYKNAAEIGLPDNAMSSIKVGKNVFAVVCDGNDFKGACEVHDADDDDLRNNPMIKNDRASSVKVVKAKVCSPNSAEKVGIKWTNKTAKAIRVNWINFGCTEESSDRLIKPGEVFDGESFTGHVFRVRDGESKSNLGLIYVTPNNGTMEIK